MKHRLESFIEIAPQRRKMALRELLAGIGAPSGCEFLSDTLRSTYLGFRDLYDHVRRASLRDWRDIADSARELLVQDESTRSLVDDGFARPDQLQLDSFYQSLIQGHRESNAKRLILRALLFIRFEEKALKHFEPALIEATRRVSDFDPPVAEDHIANEWLLLSQHLALRSARLSFAAAASSALANLAEIVRSDDANPVASANLEYIKAQQPQTAGHDQTPTHQLRKLTVALHARVGGAIRETHTPTGRHTPRIEEVKKLIAQVSARNSNLKDWLTCHILLGPYATPLLGGPYKANDRFKIVAQGTGRLVEITVPPIGPDERSDGSPAWESVSRTILLPLPTKLVQLTDRIGADNLDAYEKSRKAAERWLRNTGRASGLSITVKRLSRILKARLEPAHLEKTLLHLLGLSTPTSRDAGIYYFSPFASVVLERWREAVIGLAAELDRIDLADAWPEPQSIAGCYGLSYRPTRAAVADLIAYLRTASRRPPGRPSLQMEIATFNAHAALLMVVFLLASAARPFGDVIPTPEMIDLEDICEALLSEKDSLLYRSTRLTSLSDRLIPLYGEYNRRLDSVSRLKSSLIETEQIVVLLEESGQAVPPTFANLRRLVPGFADRWPWANDALRHYARSRLWELECHSNILARFWGHLGKSAMPDSSYATRPVRDSIAGVRNHVDRMLDELDA